MSTPRKSALTELPQISPKCKISYQSPTPPSPQFTSKGDGGSVQKVTSPALRRKLEQVEVEARARRNTPELPELENLSVTFSGDDGSNIKIEGISDEKFRSPMRKLVRSNSQNIENSTCAETTVFRSPSHRRLRVRTLEGGQQHVVDVASTERMKRNTDSMLEDVVIANKLKRRLGSRRELGVTRQTVSDTGLSDFIIKSIMEGSLDAVAAARPTNESLSHAADVAFKVCLEGYFENMQDEETKRKAKQIFLESLILEEYYEGDYICRQNDVADKLFVIEEGMVQFIIGDQVAGIAQNGCIFGELSLVYGVPRVADVKVVTPCAMIWFMDALSFRRIQALVANKSLKASTIQSSRSIELKKFRKEHSSLTDLQEPNRTWKANKVNFKSLKKNAIIGKGTFGSVYMVSLKDKERNREKYYALKCMSKVSIIERENQKRVLIEKNILKEMNSPFIVRLLGTHQDNNSIYFLTDFVQGGNLMSYMIHKDILSHSESMFFTANIVSALIHIHRKGIVHRDIKPENCLIDRAGYLKLCDFGMAKRLPCTVQLPKCGSTQVVILAFTMCGTPEFMAPEFVLSTGYDKGVDFWALGCILVEMYTGRSPFEFDGDLKKTFKEVCMIGMGRKKFSIPDQLKKDGLVAAASFAQSLLTMASKRLGREDSTELRRHEYFEGIDFDHLYNRKITAPYIPKFSHASDVSHFKKDTERLSEDKVESYDGDESWFQTF